MRSDQASIWTVTPESGFLLAEPLEHLTGAATDLVSRDASKLDELAANLPRHVADKTVRNTLNDMPVVQMHPLEWADGRAVERAFQIYAHLASAYVWCDPAVPVSALPAGVAVPLVAVAQAAERPPIMSYSATSLANHSRREPEKGFVVENLRCIQEIVGLPDEAWFHLIHVEIEATAGKALDRLASAQQICADADDAALEALLSEVPGTIRAMARALRRIPEACGPDTYYHTLRPYLFGFTDVIYEGVCRQTRSSQTVICATLGRWRA